MRNLLLLALLFYNIVGWTNGNDNDKEYDEYINKRHSVMDERRNRRKKVLLKEEENKDFNIRTNDFYNNHYVDDGDRKNIGKDIDGTDSGYKAHRRYDGIDDLPYPPPKSGEINDNEYNRQIRKSDTDMKGSQRLNCDRVHERYESCFAGCAAVTCDNPRERLRPCYPFCEQGCICVPPYVRDDRTHKCVMPENCTKGLKGIPDLSGDN